MPLSILGVRIDQVGLPQALAQLSGLLSGSGQHLIATVNPEFIMAASSNAEFRRALNSASLAVADGIGLVLAARLITGQRLERVTGVDLSRSILEGHSAAKAYLLGGAPNVAVEVRRKFPLAVVGAESGGELMKGQWELIDNDGVIDRINGSGANLLLVAFGQVKQEMWIVNNLAKMPGIKAAIGVGGTFDYLSGKVRRAPAIMRSLGLEWLYRLISEPRRLSRIWNATAGFSWLVLLDKMKMNK